MLLSILVSDVLPIFAIAAIGFFLERRVPGGVRILSAITFNALSPCLVFTQLVMSRLGGAAVGRMALYCLLLTMMMGIAARIAAIPLGLERKGLSSFLLVVMFSNSGNYALPLILFAFGSEALSHASVYFVTSAILVYTAGVLIAASGGQGLRGSLKGVLRVPALYALIAAGLFSVFHIAPPTLVMRPVGMLSDAALPMMLLILGMQLKRAMVPQQPRVVATAVALSLIVSPLIGIGLTMLLGFSGAARSSAITLASMPAAVVTTVLALEFDLDSSFVTSTVFVSTLLSPLTLVPIIALLQAP
ncbi:MAG TPA: AEC family transporter [Terriglobia bacterium]|nr:AEC family transporter [Terriglobia bacterium]